MATNTEHHAWTAKHVEQRLLEAAETLILCPKSRGPRSYGSSMPEPLRRANETYGDERTRVRRQPSAGALDRMEQCWSWINALEEPLDRQLLYRWARAKIGRGRSLKLLAMEEGMSDRTLRREITRLCKSIADQLNDSGVAQLSRPVDGGLVGADRPPAAASSVPIAPTHWRAANARPKIDPSVPAKRTIPR